MVSNTSGGHNSVCKYSALRCFNNQKGTCSLQHVDQKGSAGGGGKAVPQVAAPRGGKPGVVDAKSVCRKWMEETGDLCQREKCGLPCSFSHPTRPDGTKHRSAQKASMFCVSSLDIPIVPCVDLEFFISVADILPASAEVNAMFEDVDASAYMLITLPTVWDNLSVRFNVPSADITPRNIISMIGSTVHVLLPCELSHYRPSHTLTKKENELFIMEHAMQLQEQMSFVIPRSLWPGRQGC